VLFFVKVFGLIFFPGAIPAKFAKFLVKIHHLVISKI
jgi:hypothetical protein